MADGVPADTLQAFDRHARGYASGWGADPLARELRARVLATCARHFPAGGRILDLGAGAGLDAAVLQAGGYRVTAVDASEGMVAEARRRVSDARRVDLHDLGPLLPDGPFDGALSNFGALNCLRSLDGFGRGLAAALRPGACAVLVVMSRWCPAEDLALLRRGRRPRRRGGTVSLEGRAVPVRYLGAVDLLRALPAFEAVEQQALGALMAPPDLGGRPGLATRVEALVGGWPMLRGLGDHTLLVVRRRAEEA